MAEHVVSAFIDPFARTTDAWDLVRLALGTGLEGAPAWPAAALERLRDAVHEVHRRMARVRALGHPVDASPELASLATHLGITPTELPAEVATVDVGEGCEAA